MPGPTTVRRIACAQVQARELADSTRALSEALEQVRAASAAGADLCVLPEGTYPGYVLGSADAARDVLSRGPEAITAFGDAARAAQLEIVVGLVLARADGLLNAAVHFGRDGSVRQVVGKRFLWHFDRQWFVAGERPGTAGGTGLLVCADGRLPEIAADLVAAGARLIVNPTAWVTPLPPPEGTNPQAEFLWRVRAFENGVPAVACTKVGTEAGMCIYSGRSQIVAADGTVLAIASPREPELLVADVEIPDVARPPAPSHPSEGPWPEIRLPALRAGNAYVAVLTDDAMAGAAELLGAQLVVGTEEVVTAREVAVVALRDAELLVPGPARAAALGGCEFVVWIVRSLSLEPAIVECVARTRALENRVFVVVSRPADVGGPFVVAPSGRVVARAPQTRQPFAVGASCLLAEAATKEMAPGTDAWDGVARLTRD